MEKIGFVCSHRKHTDFDTIMDFISLSISENKFRYKFVLYLYLRLITAGEHTCMNIFRKVYVKSKRCGLLLCVKNVFEISENQPPGKGKTTNPICAHTFHVQLCVSWHMFHFFLISFFPTMHNVKLEATARLMLWFVNTRKMRLYATNDLYSFQMPCKNSMRVASKNKFPFF